MKTILVQVPDEEVYVDFDEEVCFSERYVERAAIGGNPDFESFGDNTLLQIIKGNYYDDDPDPRPEYAGDSIGFDYDTLAELEKVTGKKWAVREMHGQGQSEWQNLYYVEDEVSPKELDYLESVYMCKVNEYKVYELNDDEEFDEYESYYCHALIPQDITWNDDKKAICAYLGIDPERTKLLKYVGYHKVADFEEVKQHAR